MGKRIHFGSRGWLVLALVVSFMAFLGTIAPRGDAMAQGFEGSSLKVATGGPSTESPSTAGESGAFQAKHKLGDLLRPDGTLDPRSGFHGAVDPRGYRLVSGAGQSPRFAAASGQVPEDERWADTFGLDNGVSGHVDSMALDGNGNLYVGGAFSAVSGANAINIAKWDGSEWSALGSGTDWDVSALAVDGSGNLYAGGIFGRAGDVPVNHIAKWDGSEWSALGSGTDGEVSALAVDSSGILYAGGIFTTAGDVPVNHIAKWDGSGWSALGSGTNGNYVFSLVIDEIGNLYAAGDFLRAGGVYVNHIAKWDGTAWSALRGGLGYYPGAGVHRLAVDRHGNLYAAGQGITIAGVYAGNIVKWDGSKWSPLWIDVNSFTAWDRVLEVDANGSLYVGGQFTTGPGGKHENGIVKWDGTAWSTLGTGMDQGVDALAVDSSGLLYAGGWFTTVGGVPVNSIAKWDTISWSPMGTGSGEGINGYSGVRALAVDESGNIYAAGQFTMAGSTPARNIAKWDGTAWTPLGSGIDEEVDALAVDANGDLFAGGYFTTAGGVPANNIAKWDGTSWSAVGGGVDGSVMALAVDGNGHLYAGGDFIWASGVYVNRIAKWNGTVWSGLGSGIGIRSGTDYVQALAIDGNGNLYAGGDFNTAGGVSAKYVAKWNGARWSAVGSGMYNRVYALAADGQGNLYAGTYSTYAVGYGIAKWNGDSWSAFGGGIKNGSVSALTVDKNGDLYVGGSFAIATAGGLTANGIAKWNGTAWSPFGSGISGGGCLAVDSNGNLYAGGGFTTAGGKPSLKIARWEAMPPPAVTSVWPKSGSVGSVVTITGTGFGTSQSSSVVKFRGVTATTYLSWSDTQIRCRVPAGTTTGAVKVTTAEGTSNGITFTVIPPPTLASLFPTANRVGAVVTLTGANFGAARGSSVVKFNGVPATTYTSWSDTQIRCRVPAGAATGTVRVTTLGGTSRAISFTVIPPPVLTSLSPTTRRVGAVVTLTGANFGASRGSSVVKFNGVPATTYTSWSDVQIECNVPVGATTGEVMVTTRGGTSNGIAFTVLPAP